jgi:hypothetical protein
LFVWAEVGSHTAKQNQINGNIRMRAFMRTCLEAAYFTATRLAGGISLSTGRGLAVGPESKVER